MSLSSRFQLKGEIRNTSNGIVGKLWEGFEALGGPRGLQIDKLGGRLPFIFLFAIGFLMFLYLTFLSVLKESISAKYFQKYAIYRSYAHTEPFLPLGISASKIQSKVVRVSSDDSRMLRVLTCASSTLSFSD